MQLDSESWILARAKTMLTFLCLFGSAKEVLAASDEELEQALQIKKKRKSDSISAEHIRSLAQRSIKVSYRAAMVHDSAKLVLAYQKRDEEITAAHFLSEVPDISQLATYQELIAFAKTDPGIYESGNASKARKISKRGNPQLRKYLYLMADRCKRHNIVYHAYYHKKREAGFPTEKQWSHL